MDSNPTLQEYKREENHDRMKFVKSRLEKQINLGPEFKNRGSLYHELFELVRTRARFKATNRAFLANMFANSFFVNIFSTCCCKCRQSKVVKDKTLTPPHENSQHNSMNGIEEGIRIQAKRAKE